MARKRERIFALFGAVLFLGTSSALTVAVVWQQMQQNKANKLPAAPSSVTKAMQTKTTEDKMENYTPTTAPITQLQVIDTKVGTGDTVKPGDTITADYTGALATTGQVFDASAKHGGPISFPLTGVIAGWSQGIPGMKVGSTRRLFIPSNLAYGSQGNQGIPPNSDLVFDVTVTKIGK